MKVEMWLTPWNCSQGSSGTANDKIVTAALQAATPASETSRGTRNTSSRHRIIRVGTVTAAAISRMVFRSGKIDSRKLMVSESTISTSKKLITIQRMVNLKCDSVTNVAINSSDSAAEMPGRGNSSRKKKFSPAQLSRNSTGANQPCSVHSITPSAAM